MTSVVLGSDEQERTTMSLVPQTGEDTAGEDSESNYNYTNLNPNIWGLGVFEIINNVELFFLGEAGSINSVVLMRCFLSVGLMVVNVSLQFLLLYYVNSYIVQPATAATQGHYRQYHKEVFLPDGSFNKTAFDNWDGPRDQICNSAVSKSLFTFTVLFLWSTIMVGELRKTERLYRNVSNIRHKSDHDGKTMLEKTFKPKSHEIDKVLIESLSWRTRFAIYMFIIIPKAVIGICLLWLGCRWLAATSDFADLILNACALEFIISIDEIIFEVFIPDQVKKELECTSIKHLKIDTAGLESLSQQRAAYFRSFFFLLFATSFAGVYICFLQQVLPGYSPFPGDIQSHCQDSFTAQEATCGIGWTHWAYGLYYPSSYTSGTQCFPYGPGQGHLTGPEQSRRMLDLSMKIAGSNTTLPGLSLRGAR